jgi:hypothetical protein
MLPGSMDKNCKTVPFLMAFFTIFRHAVRGGFTKIVNKTAKFCHAQA